MPKNHPSIIVSRSESSVQILYGGFDTSIDPVSIERRAIGGAWVVIATPSDGEGAIVDTTAIEGVNYEYRAVAGAQEASAFTEDEEAKPKRAKRERKQEQVAERPMVQPVIFDPWGLIEDLTDLDPQVTLLIPKHDK